MKKNPAEDFAASVMFDEDHERAYRLFFSENVRITCTK